MVYSGMVDTKIAFVVVVNVKGKPLDRIGAILTKQAPAWVDRFGAITIRGIGPLVPPSDLGATASDKATLAKHVRTTERHRVVTAQP